MPIYFVHTHPVNQVASSFFVDKEDVAPKKTSTGKQKCGESVALKKGQNILLVTPHCEVRQQVQAPMLPVLA